MGVVERIVAFRLNPDAPLFTPGHPLGWVGEETALGRSLPCPGLLEDSPAALLKQQISRGLFHLPDIKEQRSKGTKSPRKRGKAHGPTAAKKTAPASPLDLGCEKTWPRLM